MITGGVAGGREVQKRLKYCQKEQARLCADIATDTQKKGKKKEKVAVDKVFYSRLLKILRM